MLKKLYHIKLTISVICCDLDPDPLDPYYGKLPGSGSVWRDTVPDPGYIQVQNKAITKEFCVNKSKLIVKC